MKRQLLIVIIILTTFAQQVVAQRAQVKFKNELFYM